jgi:hypothetical protein
MEFKNLWAILVTIFLGVSLGCTPPTGKVSGQVTYQGKPVPGGAVQFLVLRKRDQQQPAGSMELDRDGKFQMELPVGEIWVGIDNREFEPTPELMAAVPPGGDLPPEVQKALAEAPKAPAKVSERWMQLPEKCYLPETSGLSFKVVKGEQSVQIDIKD